MRKFILSAALVASVALAGSAQAQSAPSVGVSYSDLDLRTAAGRATLDGRLKAAVRKVCRQRFDGGVGELLGQPNCVRIVAASARRQAAIVIARAYDETLTGTALASR